jgi:hypothetical protein
MSKVANLARPRQTNAGGEHAVPQLMESTVLCVSPEQPLTMDRVLRRLEVTRQRLAVRWCGTSGAFAGYDTLTIGRAGDVLSGDVHFTARLVSAAPGSHEVELAATIASRGSSSLEATLIAGGRGRTLETAGSVAARPAKRTGCAAEPGPG